MSLSGEPEKEPTWAVRLTACSPLVSGAVLVAIGVWLSAHPSARTALDMRLWVLLASMFLATGIAWCSHSLWRARGQAERLAALIGLLGHIVLALRVLAPWLRPIP